MAVEKPTVMRAVFRRALPLRARLERVGRGAERGRGRVWMVEKKKRRRKKGCRSSMKGKKRDREDTENGE